MKELTPKQAKADFLWLHDRGYWDQVNFLEFTREHGVPKNAAQFMSDMNCQTRFHDGSRAQQFAQRLATIRRGIEHPLTDDPVDTDYESLRAVLDAAYDQAATGKGRERHARGNPFEEQHMQTISTLLDTDRGMAFQAIKKLTEGLDMADPEARKRELLGAINYIAGIVVYHEQERE